MSNLKGKSIIMFSFAPMLFDARIQREARSLYDAGFRVKIIYLEDRLMLNGVKDLVSAQANYNREMGGVKSQPVFLMSRNWRKLPKPISHLLQSIELFFKFLFIVFRNKADIYHVHDLKPAIFAVIAKMLRPKAKLVYDAHELEFTTAGKRLEPLMRRYERMVIKRSDLNITVNEEIKEIMENAYGRSVIVVGNRPPLVHLQNVKKVDLKAAFNLPENAVVLMYIGYVNTIRGIEQTILAMKFLPENVYFLIMGVGRLNEFKAYLDDFYVANQLAGIKQRVMFIGPFPPDDIINYLHSADVSMMLYQKFDDNSSFNAPNKLYQSIMARTPVLASHNESFPRVVYDNEYGKIGETVDQTDPEAIAGRISGLLDKDLQLECRANCDKLATSISWKAEEEKLVAGYNAM